MQVLYFETKKSVKVYDFHEPQKCHSVWKVTFVQYGTVATLRDLYKPYSDAATENLKFAWSKKPIGTFPWKRWKDIQKQSDKQQ